jgi:thiaminase/transcriptional activator TenA
VAFSDELRRLVDPIWEAQHRHPFVRGIGDGTLELDRFRHWVRQDYLFLIEYCRLFGLAAARAPDLATIAKFGELLQSTATAEMELHRAYADSFGIGREELERATASPTTRGYVDFLLRTAALGDFLELVSALLPCMWGFSEIGQRLSVLPRPADPRYAAWVDMYAAPEFHELTAWCRDLLDRHSEDASTAARARAEAAFVASSQHELRFWEACYQMEG